MKGIQSPQCGAWGNLAGSLTHRGRQLPKLAACPHSINLALRISELYLTDLSQLPQAMKRAGGFDQGQP